MTTDPLQRRDSFPAANGSERAMRHPVSQWGGLPARLWSFYIFSGADFSLRRRMDAGRTGVRPRTCRAGFDPRGALAPPFGPHGHAP